MSDKKQVFLSLETARTMYKKVRSVEGGYLDDNPTIVFLLDNFTKEELEAKELPKTWEELGKVKGYYINQNCEICDSFSSCITEHDENKSIFPSKELAEAALALAQLLQLRDVYNGDWKQDLHSNQIKYVIVNTFNQITNWDTSHCNSNKNYILCFKSLELRDQFSKNFKDLITTALPLL